jgi:hypothetical protein
MGAAAKRLIESEFSAQRMTEDYLRTYSAAMMKNEDRVGGPNGIAKGGTA